MTKLKKSKRHGRVISKRIGLGIGLVVVGLIFVIYFSRPKTSVSSVVQIEPRNFDECVTAANKKGLGATYDSTGNRLICYWWDASIKNTQEFVASPLPEVAALSSKKTHPGWAAVPKPLRALLVQKSRFDCEYHPVTVDSTSNDSVEVYQAGNFALVSVGCDASSFLLYELHGTDQSWHEVANQAAYFSCTGLVAHDVPVELVNYSTSDSHSATCLDERNVPHVVTPR